MVVLSKGDWVKFYVEGEERVGKVYKFMGKAVMIEHDGGLYQRYPKEFTLLPPELYPILSDSISNGESND